MGNSRILTLFLIGFIATGMLTIIATTAVIADKLDAPYKKMPHEVPTGDGTSFDESQLNTYRSDRYGFEFKYMLTLLESPENSETAGLNHSIASMVAHPDQTMTHIGIHAERNRRLEDIDYSSCASIQVQYDDEGLESTCSEWDMNLDQILAREVRVNGPKGSTRMIFIPHRSDVLVFSQSSAFPFTDSRIKTVSAHFNLLLTSLQFSGDNVGL